MKALVIIPAFNEEESLRTLIPEFNATVWPGGMDVEAIIINDASEDNTSAVARSLGVKVLDLPVNLGIGGGMQTGFCYALENGFDLVVQMDGDGQHPPAEVARLLDAVKETDIMIGSRFLGDGEFLSTRLRRFGIRYLNLVIRILTGKKITDATSGMRAMNRKALQACVNYYPDEYPEPESIVMLATQGMRIEEFPVVMRERNTGRSSIRALTSLYYMMKVSVALFLTYLRTKAHTYG